MSFQEEIEKRIKYLEQLISEKQKNLETAPDGRIEASKRGKSCQYYAVTPEIPQGFYVRKDKFSLAKALAQKTYDKAVLAKAIAELNNLKSLLAVRENGTVEEVFETLAPARQALITPIFLPDKQFVEAWKSTPYEPKPFTEDTTSFFTSKGERVRSKSEILIADALNRFHIPYRYEYPAQLGKTTVYPDFMCLNVRERKEIYWEHFGLLDDHDYRENVISKMKAYITSGIFFGDRLIITAETYRSPLDMQVVSRIIKRYLL